MEYLFTCKFSTLFTSCLISFYVATNWFTSSPSVVAIIPCSKFWRVEVENLSLLSAVECLYVYFNQIFPIILKLALTAAVADNSAMFSQDMGLQGSLLPGTETALRTLKLQLWAAHITPFLGANFPNLKVYILMIIQAVLGDIVFEKWFKFTLNNTAFISDDSLVNPENMVIQAFLAFNVLTYSDLTTGGWETEI